MWILVWCVDIIYNKFAAMEVISLWGVVKYDLLIKCGIYSILDCEESIMKNVHILCLYKTQLSFEQINLDGF
jgi:hypothetical protein